eukprot:CAMPEP_0171726032 /NCGR_PEP_ID=MMETSP0991-20121206/25370_1 /TAXON_ID=483369 /ORGANISM="non described non described, Strain CCMP2098" /LENGTH=32 /DNA_ID= /DNA_START= /DNA_END= /DNA_ORIENTATION=
MTFAPSRQTLSAFVATRFFTPLAASMCHAPTR